MIRTDELSLLASLVEREDWEAVRSFSQRMINLQSSGLLNKYNAAVDRIITEFEKLTRLAAIDPGYPQSKIDEIRAQVARYVKSLGVATLIDDIRESLRLKPRSINYYLVTHKGNKECRWGMLLSWRNEQLHNAAKAEESRTAPEIAANLGIPVNAFHGYSNFQNTNSLDRLWIRSAAADYKRLIKTGKTLEANRLAKKLQGFGISPAELLKPITKD